MMNLWPKMFETRALDLSPSGLKEIKGFLKFVFPQSSHYSQDYIHWQYVQNPNGQAVGASVFDGEKIIAHYAMQALNTVFDGVEQKTDL